MRIAFFTDTYLPNTDGIVTAIINYRNELERLGHEVYLFSPGTKKQKEENKDERVHYFTSTSFKPYPDYRIAVFNFFSPVKLVKDLKIDIIHSHGVATTGLAAVQTSQKLNIPAVATFHTMVPEAMHYITEQQGINGLLQNIAWKYLTWYYSSFKKVIAPSEFVKARLESQGIKNLIVQPAGIDSNKFKMKNSDKLRKKLSIPKKSKVILYLGRVAKEKNLEVLIEQAQSILNKLPEARFVIAGKGPAESYYADLVKSKGLSNNFVFTGYIPDEQLCEVYSLADVFSFTSTFDTQGLSIIEAMAVGVPPVVKKSTAPSEFVKDGKNGYIFNDHFDFAEKIIKAVENKEKLKENIIKTAKDYDVKTMTEGLLNIYKSAMKP